ncbi:MAG: diaminopimelate decarboxylase [Methanocellales archaeon]
MNMKETMNLNLPPHLQIKNGHLYIGDIDTVELAAKYGTPIYVTDEKRLRENFKVFKSAFPEAEIFYAAKANSNLAIMKILASMGSGMDVFSGGELYLALLAGVPEKKILFNGNSKTIEELRMAVQSGVRISVDSMDELKLLSKIAQVEKKEAEIAFRVNPDISLNTHPKIATGLKQSKFGIPYEEVIQTYRKAMQTNGVKVVGIHCHIGSQILEVSPFAEAARKMMKLVEEISKFIDLEFIDLGGGLGIPYDRRSGVKTPTPMDLAAAILPEYENAAAKLGVKLKLILEPGRYIVGDTTVLLTKVTSVKRAYKNFANVDAGFNLLIRPVMYDAYHEVIIANKADQEPKEFYQIAGPICETGDILARDRKLPELEQGDVIAILDTGAYGFAMSSQYNLRPRCAEILVCNGRAEVIRERETYGDLVSKQILPPRLFK